MLKLLPSNCSNDFPTFFMITRNVFLMQTSLLAMFSHAKVTSSKLIQKRTATAVLVLGETLPCEKAKIFMNKFSTSNLSLFSCCSPVLNVASIFLRIHSLASDNSCS